MTRTCCPHHRFDEWAAAIDTMSAMRFAGRSWALPRLLWALFLLAICLAVALPRFCRGIDYSDEGFLAYSAIRVSEGQIPNRDFVSLQPPLSFYVVAGVFKLCGTSLLSLRMFGLLLYVTICLLSYFVAHSLTKSALAVTAALPTVVLGLPYFYFVPYAAWQGIAFTLLALTLHFEAHSRPSRLLAFFSGMATALSLCARHDQALYFLVALIVLFVARLFAAEPPLRQTICEVFIFWMLGGVITFLPALGYWWYHDALWAMWQQLIVFPLRSYSRTSSLPFPRFEPSQSFHQNLMTALFYLPALTYGIAIGWILVRLFLRRFRTEETNICFLLVWGVLFYLQALIRSDIYHILITLSPLFILLSYGYWLASRKLVFVRNNGGGLRRFLCDLALSIPLIVLIGHLWAIGPIAMPDLSKANELLDLNRGRIWIDGGKETTAFLQKVQEIAPPDRSILVLPYQPMVYFLCERRNPTRWNYLWPGDQTEEDHARLIDQAKADPPLAVLLFNEDLVVTYAPTVVDYIHRNYRLIGYFGVTNVYAPKTSF